MFAVFFWDLGTGVFGGRAVPRHIWKGDQDNERGGEVTRIRGGRRNPLQQRPSQRLAFAEELNIFVGEETTPSERNKRSGYVWLFPRSLALPGARSSDIEVLPGLCMLRTCSMKAAVVDMFTSSKMATSANWI